MNWIITRCIRLSGHTYLNELLAPILGDIRELNWFISDLEYNTSGLMDGQEIPVDFDHDYFVLADNKFRELLDLDLQIYWGVILGFPASINVVVDENNLPFAEGNGLIWKNDNIQHADAQIEIVCFDSGYTIVKFRDQYLSDKFKNYFAEAIELETFSNKWLK